MNRCLVIGIGSVGHSVFQKVQLPFPYMYFIPTQKHPDIVNWHFAKFQFHPSQANYLVGKRGILHFYDQHQELDIQFFQSYDEVIIFGGIGGSSTSRILVDFVDFLAFMNYKITTIVMEPAIFESRLRLQNAQKALKSLPNNVIRIQSIAEYIPTNELYAQADAQILQHIHDSLTQYS